MSDYDEGENWDYSPDLDWDLPEAWEEQLDDDYADIDWDEVEDSYADIDVFEWFSELS